MSLPAPITKAEAKAARAFPLTLKFRAEREHGLLAKMWADWIRQGMNLLLVDVTERRQPNQLLLQIWRTR